MRPNSPNRRENSSRSSILRRSNSTSPRRAESRVSVQFNSEDSEISDTRSDVPHLTVISPRPSTSSPSHSPARRKSSGASSASSRKIREKLVLTQVKPTVVGLQAGAHGLESSPENTGNSENPLLLPEPVTGTAASQIISAHRQIHAEAVNHSHNIGPGSKTFGRKMLSIKEGRTLNAASVRANVRLRHQESGVSSVNSSLTARSLLDRGYSNFSGKSSMNRSQMLPEDSVFGSNQYDVDDEFDGQMDGQSLAYSNSTTDNYTLDEIELQQAAEYEREVFLNTVIAETIPVDHTPSNLEPPQCECGQPCCMRRPPSDKPIDQDLDACVWVCLAQFCKFHAPINGHEAWEAAIGMPPTTFPDGGQAAPPADPDPTKEEVDDFWNSMEDNMVTPDDVEEKFDEQNFRTLTLALGAGALAKWFL